MTREEEEEEEESLSTTSAILSSLAHKEKISTYSWLHNYQINTAEANS